MPALLLLSGYKTWIGLILMGVGSILELVGSAEIGEPLKNIGGLLAGIGGAHKLAKGQ